MTDVPNVPYLVVRIELAKLAIPAYNLVRPHFSVVRIKKLTTNHRPYVFFLD